MEILLARRLHCIALLATALVWGTPPAHATEIIIDELLDGPSVHEATSFMGPWDFLVSDYRRTSPGAFGGGIPHFNDSICNVGTWTGRFSGARGDSGLSYAQTDLSFEGGAMLFHGAILYAPPEEWAGASLDLTYFVLDPIDLSSCSSVIIHGSGTVDSANVGMTVILNDEQGRQRFYEPTRYPWSGAIGDLVLDMTTPTYNQTGFDMHQIGYVQVGFGVFAEEYPTLEGSGSMTYQAQSIALVFDSPIPAKHTSWGELKRRFR
jgi:hypothetical protein